MTITRNDSSVHSEAQALAVSEAHLHRSIEHYRQLLSECLSASEPSQRRMASVYRALERERRALLSAMEGAHPERCLDYLEAPTEMRGL